MCTCMHMHICSCMHAYTRVYICVYSRYVCVHVYISTSVYTQAIQKNQLLNSWCVVLRYMDLLRCDFYGRETTTTSDSDVRP